MSDQATSPTEPEQESRFTLPSAYTILFALLAALAVLTVAVLGVAAALS